MPISNNYYHTVQYHETDSMKIVHHANYVKWMEEARNCYFRAAGLNWKQMEDSTGIMIPVLFQSVDYKRAIRFGDEVEICCTCEKFNGVKMNFSYIFKVVGDDAVRAKGITKHGFIDADFTPVSIKEMYKAGYDSICRFTGFGE